MAIKLLELAKKIFGPKKVSQQMGTKTGVKLLSGGKNDPFKGIYNVEMLKNNPKALAEAKKQLENNLGYAFSNKNTLEIQRFEKNLEAVDAAMNPKSADVIPFKKDEGIMATDEAAEVLEQRTKDIAKGDVTGETSDLMTGLEGKAKEIKKAADELKKVADESVPFMEIAEGPKKGQKITIDDFFAMTGTARDPRRGVVRAAAREILNKNKVKIGREDPIDVLRKMYGEEGLEAVDAVSEGLLDAQSYGEMNAILRDNKLFDLVPKKTYGYDQSVVSAEKIRKAKEQEAKQRQILEEFDPPDRTENADGGLINILKL